MSRAAVQSLHGVQVSDRKSSFIRKESGLIGVDIFLSPNPGMSADLLQGKYDNWSDRYVDGPYLRTCLFGWAGYIEGLQSTADAVTLARDTELPWYENPNDNRKIYTNPLEACNNEFEEVFMNQRPLLPGDLILSDLSRNVDRSSRRFFTGNWYLVTENYTLRPIKTQNI